MDFFIKLLSDVGFPIAAAGAAGFFVFKMMKFILGTVVSSIRGLMGIIAGLDARVRVINSEIVKTDKLLSQIIDVQPDPEISSRSNDMRTLVRDDEGGERQDELRN
jgi:hypothetical protein